MKIGLISAVGAISL